MKNAIAILCMLLLSIQVYASPRLAPPLNTQIKVTKTNDSAEVLQLLSKRTLLESGHWERTEYVSVRLNDLQAARDYGSIKIPFNHYYSDKQLDFANVLSKDGTTNSVSKEAIQVRVVGGGRDFYSDSSEIVFSLPNISPGAVIEFQYSSKSKVLALPALYSNKSSPYWFQPTVGGDGWRMDNVKKFEMTLRYPANVTMYFDAVNGFPKPTSKTQNSVTEQTWIIKNSPTIISEKWMPQLRTVAPELSFSTHKKWQVINDWAWNNAVDKLQTTPELNTVIASLGLSEQATADEKIRAVYQYLQKNIRYVFAHLGRGGYEPHFANDVLTASYGDCKDQTILALALLKILNVPASAALVETGRNGKSSTVLPDMIFDHMMVYIPKIGNRPAQWLDTTGDRQLFPGTSNYLKGQTALILNDSGGQLTTMQEGFEPNDVHLTLVQKANKNNQTVVTARFELSGFFEQNMRSWWIHSKNRESDLDQYIKTIFPVSNKYTVEASFNHAENLWQPTTLDAVYTFDKTPENTPDNHTYAASFSQLFRLFGNFSNLQSPKTRQQHFYDPYPYSLKLTSLFEKPNGFKPAVVQSSGIIKSNFVQLIQTGSESDTHYTVESIYTRPALNLSLADYATYYSTTEQIALSDAWVVNMKKADNPTGLHVQQVGKVGNVNGEKTIDFYLALAQNQIDNGVFDAALTSAQEAIKLDNKNGQAWYLLGMSQGLVNQIDASTQSFEKAASLGYLP